MPALGLESDDPVPPAPEPDVPFEAIEAPKPDRLKMVNAWVLRDGQAYILTFLGDMDKYNQDAILVYEMIRSFQLK